LDNEDILSERDTWSKFDLEELGEISDKEDTWNKTEPDKFKFKTHSVIDYEGKGSKTTFTGAYPSPDLSNQGPKFNNWTNSSTRKNNSIQTQDKTFGSHPGQQPSTTRTLGASLGQN
jgi:hypothetical protein